MADFSSDSKLKSADFHSISKTVTESTQFPFESKYKDAHNVFTKDVLAEVLPFGDDQTTIDSWISSNPGIIKKYTEVSLTEIGGSNGQAWQLIDPIDGIVVPFIDPTDVMHSTEFRPSNGYQPILFDSSGTQLPLTAGAYRVKPYAGIIQFDVGYSPSDLGWGNPKITVYGFIGNTLQNVLDNIISGAVSYDEIIIPIDVSNKSDTIFTLNYTPIDGSVWLIINGVVQIPTQDFTVNYFTPQIELTGDCIERFEDDMIYIKYTY